jgi:hypothetical protein
MTFDQTKDESSGNLAARALAAVQQAASLRQTVKNWAPDFPRKLALVAVKSWQVERLAATYSDLKQNPRYFDAVNFFLNDLYGAHDLSARDDEVKRMLPSLVKLLPNSALRTVVEALEMDALSEQLDHELAECIEVYAPNFSLDNYAHAYRTMPSSGCRFEQIAMVDRIGSSLDKLVRQPLLGGLLAAMAGPAKVAGLTHVYDFLWRGFSAFKKMKGAKDFLQTVRTRELAEDARLRP